MITKNKLFIFPVLAVSALFLLSTFSKNDAKLSPTQTLKEEAYSAKNFKYKAPKKRSLKKAFKIDKRFTKALQKNNLSLKLAEAREEAQYLASEKEVEQEQNFDKKEQIKPKSKEKKVASKDDTVKTEEEKKASEDKKGKEKEKNIAKATDLPDENISNDYDSIEQASTLKETSNGNIISSSSIHNTPQQNAETLESDETDLLETDAATALDPGTQVNTSLNLFSKSYFKNLLVEDKLLEFEQALQLELSAEQVNDAYSEALSFLLENTEDEEEYTRLDNFVKIVFLQHRFAVNIANSFHTPEISNLGIEYSAELLNQLVTAWNFESQEDSQFSSIYQVSVINTIPAELLTNNSISNLRANITSASLEISDSSLEVSAI